LFFIKNNLLKNVLIILKLKTNTIAAQLLKKALVLNLTLANKGVHMKIVRYDLAYRLLHWTMAILIILMLMAVFGFASLSNDEERLQMLMGHSSLGFIVSLFIIARLVKRFIINSPRPEHDLAPLQQLLSTAVQYGLYVLMVWVPVTGYLSARFHELPVMAFGSFNLSQASQGGDLGGYSLELFESIRLCHELGTKALMLLLVLHIAGAMFHKLVKKDQVMASMTGKA
jgi:cytochrome b561